MCVCGGGVGWLLAKTVTCNQKGKLYHLDSIKNKLDQDTRQKILFDKTISVEGEKSL